MRTTEKKRGDGVVAGIMMYIPGVLLLLEMMVILALVKTRPEAKGGMTLALLEQQRNWALGVTATVIVGSLLSLSAVALVVVYIARHTFVESERFTVWTGAAFTGVCMVISIGLWASLILGEMGVIPLLAQVNADVTQIQDETLEEETLWLYAVTPEVLPDKPYQGGPMTRLFMVAGGETPEERFLYLPDDMEEPEGERYRWDETPEWNEANAQRYQVTYTSQFHIIVELTPLPAEEGEL